MQDEYGFVQVPHTIADTDLKNGVNFLRGYFRGEVIDKLSIYNNGMLCESQNSTDYSDDFLDEIFALISRITGFELKPDGVRAYISGVEVGMLGDVAAAFEQFSNVGQQISNLLKQYGPPADDYRFTGFKLHYDHVGKQPPLLPEFLFERRAAEPYAANVYFSSAPLRTVDHLKLLDTLEMLLV